MTIERWPKWADMPEFHALPFGWRLAYLTDIAQIIAGQSPPSETYNQRRDGLPFLQGCAEFDDEHPCTAVWCAESAKRAPSGSTLMSVRAPVGDINRADQEYAIGRGLAALVSKDADPDFLYYGLHRWRRSIQRLGQGSTFEAITARQLRQVVVALPEDRNEQRFIAAALRLADQAIQNARAELDATRDLKRSLSSELFLHGIGSANRAQQRTKLGLIPADWTVSELRSLWMSSANGLYVPEKLYGSGVPIVRIDTFNDGFFETRNFKRIRVEPLYFDAYSTQTGDLLVNRVNSIPFLGKVVYVDAVDEFMVFESNMMRLRFPTHELSQYLALYLSVPATKKRIWAMGRPAVAQLSINQRDVGKFLVALPPKTERQEIVTALATARQAEERAENKLNAIVGVKRSVLQNLLTGKIRIPATLDIAP